MEQRLLAEPDCRQKAEGYRDRLDGVEMAADVIEKALTTGRLVERGDDPRVGQSSRRSQLGTRELPVSSSPTTPSWVA